MSFLHPMQSYLKHLKQSLSIIEFLRGGLEVGTGFVARLPAQHVRQLMTTQRLGLPCTSSPAHLPPVHNSHIHALNKLLPRVQLPVAQPSCFRGAGSASSHAMALKASLNVQPFNVSKGKYSSVASQPVAQSSSSSSSEAGPGVSTPAGSAAQAANPDAAGQPATVSSTRKRRTSKAKTSAPAAANGTFATSTPVQPHSASAGTTTAPQPAAPPAAAEAPSADGQGPAVSYTRRSRRQVFTPSATARAASIATANGATSSSAAGAAYSTGGNEQDRRPVLLVDGNGLAHRSYHALMNRPGGGFFTSNGTPTSVCAGVLKTLFGVIQSVQPRAVLVAFDHGSPFRKELAARLSQLTEQGGPEVTDEVIVHVCQELTHLTSTTATLDKPTLHAALKQALPGSLHSLLDQAVDTSPYKAGRQILPPAFKQDMFNLQCLLAAMRIPCLSVPHVEADDTLAALVKAAAELKHPVSVLSSDQDMLQLVDDARDVQVMLIQRPNPSQPAVQPYKVMKEADVVDKLGVLPTQFAEYRALTGDSSDSIPGVTGIGAVGARKLIQEHQTVDGIFAALPSMTGTTAKKLAAGRRDAYVSRLLSQLGGVHVNLGEAAHELFQQKGFRRDEVAPLLQRLEMKEALRYLPTLQAAMGGESSSPMEAEALRTISSLIEGPPGFDSREVDKGMVIEVPTVEGDQPSAAATPVRLRPTPTPAAQPGLTPTAAPQPGPTATAADNTGTAAEKGTVRSTGFDSFLVQSISVTSIRHSDLSKVPDLVASIKADLAAQVASPGTVKSEPIVAICLELNPGPASTEPKRKKSSSKASRSRSRSVSQAAGDGAPSGFNPATSCVNTISLAWPVPPAAQQPTGPDARQQDGQPAHVNLRSCVIRFDQLWGSRPDAEQTAAMKAVWTLLSDPSICKAVHDAKPWHRLALELGLGPPSLPSPPRPTPQPPHSSQSPHNQYGQVAGSLPEAPWQLGCTTGLVTPVVDTLLAAYLANPALSLLTDHVASRWEVQCMAELAGVAEFSPGATTTTTTTTTATTSSTTTSTSSASANGDNSSTSPKEKDDADVASYETRKAAEAAQIWLLAAHLNRQYIKKTRDGEVYDATNKEAQKGLTLRGRQLLEHLEQPLQEVLADVEKTGVLVDGEQLRVLAAEAEGKLKQVEQEVRQLAGDNKLNVASNLAVQKLLFDKLKLHEQLESKIKLASSGKTGNFSTAAENLRMLQDLHPVVPRIGEFRSLQTLLSGCLDSLIEAVAQSHDGRVHTTFLQTGAVTGRFSSMNPNLQGIPSKSGFADRVRAAFMPRPGWRIMSADYSQMELRIMAALSGEPVLCDAFRQDQDAHSTTAMKLFNLTSLEEVTPQQRQIGKQINFGVIYGMGPRLLASGAGLELQEARDFIEQFKREFSHVTSLMDSNRILAATQGYVETAFGRRRFFDFQSPALLQLRGLQPHQVKALPSPKQIKKIDEDSFRAAGNAPIQGTAADLMKLAMVKAGQELRQGGYQSKILLTVHDELVLEVEPSEEEDVKKLVVRCMEGADGGLLSSVPLKVEVEASDHWV